MVLYCGGSWVLALPFLTRYMNLGCASASRVGCVSDETIMIALAYQADPSSVDPVDIKPRPRSDTLYDIFSSVLPAKRGSQA